ncbi:MAG TPA: sugar phosphate isomerase/epimerase family protein [Candidatus Acidoferrum sp.]|nr:sugar phosphate isomerase/epimerase family protein [Candidatus Acidoferrum sp.]
MRALLHSTRRRFLAQSALAAAGASLWPRLAFSADSGPHVLFPTEARERIAIASYPFRDFILGSHDDAAAQKMDLKDFAAHCGEKFNIRKVEPWNRHFRSTDAKYLDKFRASVEKTRGAVVNIAVDGDHSPYAADASERDQAVTFSKKWIDVAVAIGSPCVRTNIAEDKASKPDLDRAADSLKHVVEYAAAKNIVVHLENDNAITEDPFFLVQLIERVNSPWLHSNPDFCNTLATGREEYAYKGIAAMFQHAYGICHVKDMETNEKDQVFRVDMAKTFGILKRANYRGYCSMEFDTHGDPYPGTAALIAQTLQYLA